MENEFKSHVDVEVDNFRNLINDKATKAFNQLGLSLLYTIPEEDRIKFEESLGFEPVNAIDYYNLGVRDLYEEKIKDAEKKFKKALKLDPEHLGSYYNLGIIYQELGDKNSSAKYLQDYVDLYKKKLKERDKTLKDDENSSEAEFYKNAKKMLK